MSDSDKPKPGTIVWCDLTVEHAEDVRAFYADVVGWETKGVSLGDYEDYELKVAGSGDTVAGVCHARGTNENVPPQWLVYVSVENVEESARKTVERGGKVVDGPRSMGGSPFCIVQDPAGAVLALIEG